MIIRNGINIGATPKNDDEDEDTGTEQNKTDVGSTFDFGSIVTKIKDNAKWIVIGVAIYYLLNSGSEGKEKGDTIIVSK